MNIVPLTEGDDIVDVALRTAPIGHVYLGLDVVVDGAIEEFRWSDLFAAKSPNDLSREGLISYPKRTVKESAELLEEIPEFIYL
jgi:hypothetical protein